IKSRSTKNSLPSPKVFGSREFTQVAEADDANAPNTHNQPGDACLCCPRCCSNYPANTASTACGSGRSRRGRDTTGGDRGKHQAAPGIESAERRNLETPATRA